MSNFPIQHEKNIGRGFFIFLTACVVLIYSSFSAFSISPEKNKHDRAKQESVRIEKLLKGISADAISSNPDSIERVLDSFSREFQLDRHPSFHALWYRLKAKVFGSRDEFRQAYDLHLKAYALYKQISDKSGQIVSLNSMGMQCMNLSLYAEAYDYFFSGLLLAEETGDSLGVSLICENTGNLYTYMEEYDKAEKYFKRSLAIEEKNEDRAGYYSVKNNLAAIYYYQKKYEKAKREYEACMEYYAQQKNTDLEILAMHNTAGALIELKRLPEARTLIEQSLKYIDSTSHKEYLFSGFKMLGQIDYMQGNYKSAIAHSNRAIHYYPGGDDKEALSMLYLSLANTYECLGDYREAYRCLEKYRDIFTKNIKIRSQRDLLQKDVKLEFARKQLEDSLRIAGENRIKDARLSQQNAEIKLKKNQQLFMIFTVVLLATALAFIYKRLKVNEKQKKIIGIQKTRVEEQKQEILSSIEYARRIQRAILPAPQLMQSQLPEHFLIYQPKDIVAGDFYWMQQADGNLYLAVCDCTGHGVPGAMVSVVCNNALNRSLNEFGKRDPGRILDKTRELVVENFSGSEENVQDGMDASILCILPGQQKVLWSGANHPLWIYRQSTRMMEVIQPDKQAIGKTYAAKNFSTLEINLDRGDRIYLFTDGYADQFGGAHGKKLTRKKFMALLNEIAVLPMEEQKRHLLEFHQKYKGNEEQVDDICVMGVSA